MKRILSFFIEQDKMFYVKIFFVIFVVVAISLIISKIISIISETHKTSQFNKKQEQIKKNKRNISELNKRAGISGRISSAAFTENVDIEDIKENNNVDLRIKRVSSKDLNQNQQKDFLE